MNIKMAINSQLSTTESKKQTKQRTRTGIESQIQRSFGRLSAGMRKRVGGMEEKIQGLRSIIGMQKIDLEMLRIVQEMEKLNNVYAQPINMN